MGIVKKIQKFRKNIKSEHVIAFFGLIGVIILLREFNKRRTNPVAGMSNDVGEVVAVAGPEASKPLGQNEDYAAVAQGETDMKEIPNGTNVPTLDPADLLPSDQNNEWAKLNPTGAGDLDSISLLKAGFHNGIDTVGGSLRNANLQVRSEPANPTNQVSPWGNTTITPDLMRTPLELGNNPM
tara:strand:- start:881 stop:1426 length:546 start_codon:yes stop_codon:yes gene_type:complete